MPHIERIDPPTLVEPRGYSHVAVATGGRTIYVGGQVGSDATGAIVAQGDYQSQTAQALTNVRLALESAGASPQDIVKLTLYVVDYAPPVLREVMRGFKAAMATSSWASTPMVLAGVTALGDPDALIEVEAIAVAA